jgi:hypothetical protein
MPEKARIVEYFYARVRHSPGEGRRLLEHLSEKGVNLIAFTGFPAGEDLAQLDFFPEEVEALKSAAADAGIELVGPRKAFLIQGDDRLGALHDYHLRLANAGVNVHAANGVVDGEGRFGYIIWVKPAEFDRAARALGI